MEAIHDDSGASDERAQHERMRIRIVAGQVRLDYRALQRLCRLNGLKAIGKKQVLEDRLLAFFRRPEENEKEDEKEGRSASSSSDYSSDLRFIADLRLAERRENKMAEEGKEAKKATRGPEEEARVASYNGRVVGKFTAAPAPTGRAACRFCREKIAKNCVRVTEHDLERWNDRATRTMFYTRSLFKPFVDHYHATCFLKKNFDMSADDNMMMMMDKIDSNAELSAWDEDAQRVLKDGLIMKNIDAEKDKKWRQLRRNLESGALIYPPPNTFTSFGASNPLKIETTLRRLRHHSGNDDDDKQ